jgi:hypothetical protein
MKTGSAAAQALGYYYQISYALYYILSSDVDIQHAIQLEEFDDIDTLTNEAIKELLELKHHLSDKTISDRSSELWRTLRIWSEKLDSGIIELPGTKLKLITTARASEDSIAALLRPRNYPGGIKRDPVQSCQKLQIIAKDPSPHLEKFTKKFDALSADKQRSLVEAIEVFDCAPNITKIEDRIKLHLQTTVPLESVEDFCDEVMAKWRSLVIAHLKDNDPSTISTSRVKRRIFEMSQRYRPSPLPAYSRDDLQIDESVDLVSDERMFVKQLLRIDIRRPRILMAIRDWKNAYKDRNLWIEKDLYWSEELYSYDDRLEGEWKRIYYRHLDRFKREEGIEVQEAKDRKCIDFGQVLYDEVSDVSVPVNDQTNYDYVTRGSYQELANELRVWWHPKFIEEVKNE